METVDLLKQVSTALRTWDNAQHEVIQTLVALMRYIHTDQQPWEEVYEYLRSQPFTLIGVRFPEVLLSQAIILNDKKGGTHA